VRNRPSSFAILVLLSSLLVVAGACTSSSSDAPSHPRAPGEEVSGESGTGAEEAEADEGLAEELAEQTEGTQERLEALEEARADGALGVTGKIANAPAPGWAGERLVNATGDDWEPAVAADPNAPYVYILHNRYGGEPACKQGCPDPAMILHVSKDGGATWRPERYVCTCKGVKGQFDPLIDVVRDTGDVDAVWMNNFTIVFSSSTDHGKTWSKPVLIHPDVNWGDKPNMAISPDGQDVYVLFNGPSGGDVYAAVSHDAGASWSTTRVTDNERYHFDYGGVVLRDGRVVFSHISFLYAGDGGAPQGPLQVHTYASDDDGATWTEQLVDELEVGTECPSKGCYEDFYDSGPVLAADPDGDLVIVYNGAAEPLGPRTVYARSSTDGGLTWSDRVQISKTGVNAAFPAAVGFGDDEARVWFMDQRTGRWNVRYTTSSDLGATWSAPVRISDARRGTAYIDRDGFLEAYGDYGEIAITSEGRTIGVWGEGPSYNGPGGVWFNVEA
jgi:hypothetical protein